VTSPSRARRLVAQGEIGLTRPAGREAGGGRARVAASWHDGGVEATRVDRWLWAVRVYKTRGAATDACRGGHVRVNGSPAKAATSVRVGDRVEVRAHGRQRSLEVARVLDKRVGAPLAAECLVDHSPPPAPAGDAAPSVFARDRGSGRPTKRDRRQLDRFRTR
jgi:ribosome-associated heat shock protein Hsp15